MLRAFRVLYAVSAWAFLIGLLGQVLLIGMYLFSDPSAVAAHRDLGWILHLWPLLVLLFAALSRAGRRHWLWAKPNLRSFEATWAICRPRVPCCNFPKASY